MNPAQQTYVEPLEWNGKGKRCIRVVMLLQAGTYIKEFVHSDEGRTQPHLAGLLGLTTPAQILQLDVNKIHMDFLNDATTQC